MIRPCPSCGQKNRIRATHVAAVHRCGACKTEMRPPAAPLAADAVLFDELVAEAPVPVLVDFWADWCGPCHRVAPEVARVAEEMAGRAVVLKVDTEREPALAARYGVQGIPNFVVLRKGQVVLQQAGVVSAAQMRAWLERAAA